uniref:Small ribosomal subunit protein bS18m n=1 Tax=Coturnix japonica TaxID=93934 RepID=A0A8C2TD32_COTJA
CASVVALCCPVQLLLTVLFLCCVALAWGRPCRLQHQQAEAQSDLLLSQFVSPYTGRVYGRHITGLCDKKQKEISKAVKRAHIFGFMPVMFKNPAFLTDPKICNVKY